MIFCKKCGSMVIPKKINGKTVAECSCGYVDTSGEDVKFTSKSKKEEINVEVREDSDERLPICEMKCEKCGNDKVYFWEIQTRASDEPPTRFYRCTKCKQTWREYS